MNKSLTEADITSTIDVMLIKKGWCIKGEKKNIFCEYPIGRKRADRVLFLDNKPFLVLEVKKKSTNYNLKNGLEQAIDYAENIGAPVACVTNGSIIKTYHLIDKKPLFYNDSEIDFFIPNNLANVFSKKHKFNNISKEVRISRENLISIFKKINNLLQEVGISAGIQRINEFCNILFLKLFSEQNIKNINELYLWENFKNTPDNSLLEFFKKNIIPEFQKKYSSDVFIQTEIKNSSVLRKIIQLLDPLKLIDLETDIKGDAFEYFISVYSGGHGQKTDLGEYFTPRHIVKNTVKIVNPKIGETILDPFCGTGGFLIEVFKHIHQQISLDDKTLLKKLQKETIFGQEITSTSRLAKMNMILAGDGHNNIIQCDSLKVTNKQKYDLIITNIPFGNQKEQLYIETCLNFLKKGGRMAIIIPDGILSNQKNLFLRKKLYNNFDIKIISMPMGMFEPYTSVKTSILIANSKKENQTNSFIKIYKIESDGFSLDKKRKKLLTIQNDWDRYHLEMLKIYTTIPTENNNYSFLNQKEIFVTLNNDYPKIKLSDVVNIQKGNNPPKDEKAYIEGKIPFFKVSDIAKFHIKLNLSESVHKINPAYKTTLKLFKKNSLLIPTTGESCKLNHRALISKDSYVASTITVLTCDENKILPLFLFYCLLFVDMGNFVKNDFYPGVDSQMFKNILIPLPTIKEQEKIIKNLIPYNKIIEQSKKIYANWRPHFVIKKEWKSLRLKEISSIIQGVSIKKFISFEIDNTKKIDKENKVEFIKSGQVRGLDKFNLKKRHYSNENLKIPENKLLQNEDLILNKQGIGTAGRICFFKSSLFNNSTTINTCGYIIRANKQIINPRYLLYFMSGIIGFSELHNMAIGTTGQIQIPITKIENLIIKFPSLEEQEKIIQSLNVEYELIKNQKKIIHILNQKIKQYCESIGLF
ncbi:Type I restriction-modification system, methyltransferase subunit [Candidatus Phytoplasma mali]|uniref:site-specific DNA-methyltransferase (adenine-specific) n=1 Tax=Phytoplasma mali (strain AT) TaxID=482235 RepID=B3QZM0_PHYMT|nr:N-6 DNA methylase [Candidatus Phytoplasma mali]CAP18407.1 Type I restriction-modification system, methyltransferase subunit [Candidatus Phytoplasma mali]